MDALTKDLLLRPTIVEDFPFLVAIEREAFPNPWPEEAFTDFLLPWAWTLEFEHEIVGYIFYHGVCEEMVIINIALKPAYQGKGWGEYLLMKSMDQLILKGVIRFYLDVRVSNVKARSLYEKHGFQPIGIRKNYYSHPEEDAIVMGKQVS